MWANKYIGIPYKDGGRNVDGLDCWGLVRLVYKNEYNIDLPSFNDEYVVSDKERIVDLISQYKEGWQIEESPKEGHVVLLKILGNDRHVGVLVNDKQFLHVSSKNLFTTIENLDSIRWKNRVAGFHSYKPETQIILSGRPHPLKTQNFSFPVSPGTKLIETVKIIAEKYNVSQELLKHLLIIVNGKIIHKNDWSSYSIQENDRIEYRARLADEDVLRVVGFIALIWIAPYAAGFIQTAMATSLTTAFGMFTTGLIMPAWGTLGMVLTGGVMLAGSYLMNAIAPVRPPEDNTKDPGMAQAQMIATGTQNPILKYETIPIVLGKMRITPPLGAQNFITYQNEIDTYLSLFLCWGYGPLVMDTASMRIGNLGIDNYTIEAIEHQSIEFTGALTNRGTNNQDNFDLIYGNDIAQVFENVELENDFHPDMTGVTPGVWHELSADIASLDSSDAPYTSIEIALHFPEGLRRIKTKDEDAGTDYDIGSYGPIIEFEIKYGGGSWGSSFTKTYNLPKKKDAFTITENINITATRDSIAIRARRLNAGRAEYPTTNDSVYATLAANSGYCVQDTSTYGPITDSDGYTYYDNYIVTTTTSHTSQLTCQVPGSGRRWISNISSDNENAKKWRYCFKVNLLSLTARRQQKPFIAPINTDISRTAIRLKSSREINGALEGINAIVQTKARIWNGTDWSQKAATSNPASLFIHVLTSPANPRRIPDNLVDIAARINLAELAEWYTYCESHNPKFRFNALVNGTSSVLDVLKDICAAGRASPTQIDGKWTVVIDRARTNIIQYFGPHNSWGFESTRNLNKIPDGLRITFNNEETQYQQSEHIVFKSLKNRNNSELYETISLPGITNVDLVDDHARWHIAQAVLRREIYTINTDMEYLVCNRGDRVTVSHDVPMWGLGSGRIKKVLSSTLIEIDDPILIDPTINYIIRIRNSSSAVVTDPNAGPAGAESLIQKSGFTYSAASRDAAGVVTLTISSTDPNPFSVDDLISVSGTLGGSGERISEVGIGFIKYKTTYTTASTDNTPGTISLAKGLFRKITLVTPISFAREGDLFLVGNSVQKTNDLIVLGIETTSNKNGRIILTDYAPKIFTDYKNESASLAFETNITLPPGLAGFELKDRPVVTDVISDDRVSILLSNNVWKYKLRISYANFILDTINLNTANTGASPRVIIQSVECEYSIAGGSGTSNERSIIVPYSQLCVDIDDVQIDEEYKARLRYISTTGIKGPWTPTITALQFPQMKIVGKDRNYGELDDLVVYHQGRYLDITPVAIPTPKDFKHYEIRTWKDSTATGDFWDKTTYVGTITKGSDIINLTSTDHDHNLLIQRIGKTPQKITGVGSFGWTGTLTSPISAKIVAATATTLTMSTGSGANAVEGTITFTLDREILGLATSQGTYRQDLLQFERPRLNQAGVVYRVNSRVVSAANTYSQFSGIRNVVIGNLPPGPSIVKPGAGSFTLEVSDPSLTTQRIRTDTSSLRVYMSDVNNFIPNNDYAEIIGSITGTTLTVTAITKGRLAPGAVLQGAGIAPGYTGYQGNIVLNNSFNVSTGALVTTTSRIVLIKGLNSGPRGILNLRPGQYIKIDSGTGSFGLIDGQPALGVIDTVDSNDQITVRIQTNGLVSQTTPSAGSVNFSISTGITSFSDIAVSIISGPVIKFGSTPAPTLPATYTLSVNQGTSIPAGTFIRAFSNRVYDAKALLAFINDVYPEKIFYYRHALLSELAPQPDPDYLEDYNYSDQGEVTVSSAGEAVDNTPPPTPSGISVTAGMARIVVKFETRPAYNLSGNPATGPNTSSSHKATVMYMLPRRNKTDTLTFENAVAGTYGTPIVHYLTNEQEWVTSVPADPGTIYYIWFKNLSKANVQSLAALGPMIVETGVDIEKMLHVLTGKIAAGQLYNSLGSRIDAVDRGDKPIATKVEQLEGQYTVKIDNGGNVAGYGLSSTGSGLHNAESQFGVRADYFWVAPVSHVSSTEPPLANRYKGYVWVDTSTAGTQNVGAITGVDFYYNTYKPDIHNSTIFPDNSTLHYWEQYSSEDFYRRTGFIWNTSLWSDDTDYAPLHIVEQALTGKIYYWKLPPPSSNPLEEPPTIYGRPPLSNTTYWAELDPNVGLVGKTPDNLIYKDKWIPSRAYSVGDVVRIGIEFFQCKKAYVPKPLNNVSTLSLPVPADPGGAESSKQVVKDALENSTGANTGHRFSCDVVPGVTTLAANTTVYAIKSSTGTYNDFIGYSYNPLGTFYYIMGTPTPSDTKFSLSTRYGGPGITTQAGGTTKYWVRKLPPPDEDGEPLNIPDEDLTDPANQFTWTTDKTRVAFPFIVVTEPLDEANNNGVRHPTGVFIDNAFIRNASITNAKIAYAAIDDAKISFLSADKITTGVLDAGRITAGSIDASKISTTSLSALNANLGVVTAGVARSSDGQMTIDFNSKYIRIET